MKKEVLIIDDNQGSHGLERFLKSKGYSPVVVDNIDEGLEKIKKVVLINVELSGESGLDALEAIKENHPEVIVIVIRAGVNTARQAMCLGALDVMSKRSDMERIRKVLDKVFGRLSIRNRTFPIPEVEMPVDPYALIGDSELMFEVNKAIGRVTKNKISVLIEGETGTGKELVARLIHKGSERKEERFISIDCGALPNELLESEFFGYEKGAFSGAREKGKKGRLELANGGTLFLDEVGNMTSELQETLLNVLQTGEFMPLGGTEVRSVDVRVVSATNQNLREMVEEGKFREDLFYRLCSYKVVLPPLRERMEDIPLLTTYFLQRIEKENGRPMYGVSENVMRLFQAYNWPGNVRELESCLKEATINSQGDVILPNDLPQAIRKSSGDEGSEEGVPEMRSSETRETPIYENLLDLPVVVFCRLISDAELGVTDSQITEWWEKFSDDGHSRIYKAKREIDNWLVEWNTSWLTFPKLSERIQRVIDDAISQLSNLRDGMDSEPIAEAEPIGIKRRTLKGSLTAILHEIVKEHSGQKEKAARELRISLQSLEKYLSYWREDDGSLRTSIEPSRQLERFRYSEIRRLLTEPINLFILENFSRTEWRNKRLQGQMRTVHLALKVLSKRLAGDHGCIYFGGMTFSRIEWNIYHRAPYIYVDHAQAAEALNVDLRTFKKFWPEEKEFPDRCTLFTG